MSGFGKRNGARLPIALTVLMIVGAGWAWVAERDRGGSADDVAARLASFAAEGSEESESTALCCPSLKGAALETALAESKATSADHCPGSATSAKADMEAAHCGGSPAASCPGSASSKVETAAGDAECCPGSSSSKADMAGAGEIDPEIADLIATIKIPQVDE